jgi:tetratricopeptide (TPR) repeat protein
MPNKTRPTRISATAIALLFASLTANALDTTSQRPASGLTGEFVYKYLVGEIAGQRGDPGLAGSLFYDLAKSSRDPRLAERATHAAAYANQPQLALQAASLWAELDPASNEAQQAAAQLLLGTGNLGDALPHLQKLLIPEASRASEFLYLDSILARYADKAAVLSMMQSLAKPYPKLAEAHFCVAHSAWAAGKPELAMDELKLADKLSPGWELAALLRGEMLLGQSPEDALHFYQEFLGEHPLANEVRLAYAKLLVNQKQFALAREQFAPLAESSESNPEIAVAAGLLSAQLDDFVQADHYFEQALERGFKQPDQLYLYLGQSAESQKQDDKALDWYRRVGEGEQYFDAQLHIATVLARQGKLDDARKLLHGLTHLDNEQQVVALQLEANLLSTAKNDQEAYAVLERAVTTLPNTPELIYDYAMEAEKVQRYDVMEKQLRTLMVLKPDFAQAYNALGYTLADRNERLDEAARLIDKALALSPNDYYILDSMGWLQYRLGKLDQAADYLQRAYAMQADPEVAAHLGEVLWQQGKHDQAQQTWNNALREHPDNELLIDTAKKFGQ